MIQILASPRPRFPPFFSPFLLSSFSRGSSSNHTQNSALLLPHPLSHILPRQPCYLLPLRHYRYIPVQVSICV